MFVSLGGGNKLARRASGRRSSRAPTLRRGGGVGWERAVLRSSVKLDGNAFDSDECGRVLNGNALANAQAANK